MPDHPESHTVCSWASNWVWSIPCCSHMGWDVCLFAHCIALEFVDVVCHVGDGHYDPLGVVPLLPGPLQMIVLANLVKKIHKGLAVCDMNGSVYYPGIVPGMSESTGPDPWCCCGAQTETDIDGGLLWKRFKDLREKYMRPFLQGSVQIPPVIKYVLHPISSDMVGVYRSPVPPQNIRIMTLPRQYFQSLVFGVCNHYSAPWSLFPGSLLLLDFVLAMQESVACDGGSDCILDCHTEWRLRWCGWGELDAAGPPPIKYLLLPAPVVDIFTLWLSIWQL